MASYNKIILAGNIGKDCETRDVNDVKVMSFTLAVSQRWTDKDGNPQEKTVGCQGELPPAAGRQEGRGEGREFGRSVLSKRKLFAEKVKKSCTTRKVYFYLRKV